MTQQTLPGRVRSYIRRFPELQKVKDLLIEQNGGRFPCCGELQDDAAKMLFEETESNEKLKVRLRDDGLAQLVLKFEGEIHVCNLK